jgi:Chaperone of endosialidase
MTPAPSSPSRLRSRPFSLRRLPLIAVLILLAASQARAAETVPGNACGTGNEVANTWQWAGGKENNGVFNGMFCNGSNWAGVINFQSTGNVAIGNTAPGALLDIGKATSTLGTMRLEGNTSGYVQIQPAAAAGSWTMTLPANAGTNGYVLQTNGSGVTSWVSAGAGSPALSAITAATGANTINSAAYAQEWDWNSLSSGNGLTLGSTSLTTGSILYLSSAGTAAGASETGLNITLSGANAGSNKTTYGAHISNTHSANGSTNVGLYATASGGATANYAGIFDQGNVGIGTTAPAGILDVVTPSNYVGTATATGIVSDYYNSNGIGAVILARAARGTLAAPTALLLNDTLGNVEFSGYDGTAWAPLNGVPSVTGVATQNWAVGAHGSGLSFWTTPNGGTADAERMFIDQSGNVGIGTTTPGAALTVQGTGTGSYQGIEVSDNFTNNTAKGAASIIGPRYANANTPFTGLTTWDDNTNRWVELGGGGWSTPDATEIQFFTAPSYTETVNQGVARMTINNTGNVGIGTISPIADGTAQTLTMDGAGGSEIWFNQAGTNYGLLWGNISNMGMYNDGGIGFYTNAAGISMDANDINVGINQGTPALALDVAGVNGSPATSGTTQTGFARFEGDGTYGNVLDIGGGNNVSPTYGLWLQGTDRGNLSTTYPILLNPNGGNVGIGTSNPTNTLHVKSSSAWPTIAVQGGTSSDGAQFSAVSSSSYTYNFGVGGSGLYSGNMFFIYNANTSSFPLGIDSTGKVGIGTMTPGYTLDVNGQIHVGTLASASGTSICRNGNVLSSCSSSIRYKENVKDAPFGLKDVMKMRPVTFKWKGRDENDLGFIAEEMEKVNKLFVSYEHGRIEGVKYPQLTSVLANAIKEQQAEIKQQQEEIDTLKALNDKLKATNDNIDARLKLLEAAQH